MMEMDKKYNNTTGPGRGVGFSPSLLLFHALDLRTWMCCTRDLLREDWSCSVLCTSTLLLLSSISGLLMDILCFSLVMAQPHLRSSQKLPPWSLQQAGISPGVSLRRVSLFSDSAQAGLLLSVTKNLCFTSDHNSQAGVGHSPIYSLSWEVQDCRWLQTTRLGWKLPCLHLTVLGLQQHLPWISSFQPGHPSWVRLLGNKECEWKRQVKS